MQSITAGDTLWSASVAIEELLPYYYRERGEAETIASMLLQEATGLSRTEYLLARKGRHLSADEAFWLDRAVARMQHDEPVQYVIGRATFGPLELHVGSGVLIPRPETEELCDRIVRQHRTAGADYTLLDVGTGSGCIPLYIASHCPAWQVYGMDYSKEALHYARMNFEGFAAAHPERTSRPILLHGDLFRWADGELPASFPSVDILVSNPPYIPEQDKDEMLANVLNHEPHSALFVPDEDPLRYYKALIRLVSWVMNEEKPLYFYCETHHLLAESVSKLCSEQTNCVESVVKKDLNGRDRFVFAIFVKS